MLDLRYQIQTASKEDIYKHLKECNNNFVIALENKVDLREYSKKITNNAVTFEAWKDNLLIGLVAGYFNDVEKKIGYITNVSVTRSWNGKGVAFKLINQCIEYAKKSGFNEIDLEVSDKNTEAIQLYRKVNFVDFEKKDDMILMKLKIND